MKSLKEQFQHEDNLESYGSQMALRTPQTSAKKTEGDESLGSDMNELVEDENAMDAAFSTLVQLTGINDVDKLISRLVETEEKQFGLFSRIAELEAEASENEARIAEAQQELKRVQLKNCSNNTHMNKILLSMKDKQEELQDKSHEIEVTMTEKLDVWNTLRSRILTVHEELGLSMPETLAETDHVTEHNVFQYLAAIEKKLSEILFSVHDESEDDELYSPAKKSGAKNGLPSKTKMQLPSATDDELSQVDDDEERPLSLSELQYSYRVMG